MQSHLQRSFGNIVSVVSLGGAGILCLLAGWHLYYFELRQFTALNPATGNEAFEYISNMLAACFLVGGAIFLVWLAIATFRSNTTLGILFQTKRDALYSFLGIAILLLLFLTYPSSS